VQGKKETVEVWVVFGRGQGEEENRLVSVSVRLICERERLGCVQPREGKTDRGEEKENGEMRERPVES